MATPIARKLKKGELLFNEGDLSKSMYFVQSGALRLFKRKGHSSVELGMIHKGEVVGEMGFLDGGPRSASAEAMHDTDLLEITNISLAEQLKTLPPWLLVLLKTVVNRLRSANNKIRQLESSSTAYTYGTEGVSTSYQFLSTYDVLKILTACLVATSRNGETSSNGPTKCSLNRINKYANQIIGIHENKINELLDILERIELCKIDRATFDKVDVTFTDIDTIELLITFVNDENLKDHSKRVGFNAKSVALMGHIVKHSNLFPTGADGVSIVNLAKIIELEKIANGGKEPFRLDDSFTELVKAKLASDMQFKDSANILTSVKTRELLRMYRIQKVMKEVEIVNEKKREQTMRNAVGHR